MNVPLPRLCFLVAVLLVAACDGNSYESVTAPTPPPGSGATLTFAGTATIAGVGSADPAGDCPAAAIRGDVGRAWDLQLELTDSGDGRTGSGRLTSPLFDVAGCELSYANNYGELEIRPSPRCRATYGEWSYGSTCADSTTTVQLIYMQIDSFEAEVIRGTGEMTFERSPAPSVDLGILLDLNLQRR